MSRLPHATQVLALTAGLPRTLVDEILTAAESALRRHGAARIHLDTSQPAIVVMAELPEPGTDAGAASASAS